MEKKIKMVVDIEEALRKEFKIVAAQNKTTMKAVVIEAIKEWIEINKK